MIILSVKKKKVQKIHKPSEFRRTEFKADKELTERLWHNRKYCLFKPACKERRIPFVEHKKFTEQQQPH